MIDRSLCKTNSLYCATKTNSNRSVQVKNYLLEIGLEERDLSEIGEKLSFSLSDKCSELFFSDCRELSSSLFLLISKQENLKRKAGKKSE